MKVKVNALVARIEAIAKIAAASPESPDPLVKVEVLVREIELRRSKCRLASCRKPYFRRKFRAEEDGFCGDPHRSEWHRTAKA